MINIFQPCLGQEELDRIRAVFKSNWIGKGNEVSGFERQFAALLNTPPEHFTSTTCATEGLFLAPELFGLWNYDVIVPTVSFVAVGNAVLAAEANLILCDVDPHTLNVRAEDIRKKLTASTKAVYVTHYGGVPCNMDPILALCRQRDIIIIEDAACAPGACYKGRACGTMGDMGVWSFDAMKILVTGDGGMIYLKDPDRIERAKESLYLGLPGKSKSGIDSTGNDRWWEFDVNRPGRRAIMNDIAGAIGLAQLAKLPAFINKRRAIEARYRDGLKDVAWLTLCPNVPESCTSSYYMFWVQTEHRDKLARHLLQHGIYTTFRYWPLHRIDFFEDDDPHAFPNADYAAARTLNLPIHQSLKEEDVTKVIETIKSFPR